MVLEHARTFSLAGRLLPSVKRRAAFALYATCRRADDLVDVPERGHLFSARLRLGAFRSAAMAALSRPSDDPILRELSWAVREFGIHNGLLEELFDGISGDLETRSFADWPDLESYCEAVAGSVGAMTCAIFGAAAETGSEQHGIVVSCARRLGVAMQLTNILRDVGEDARRGRCYLPADEMADHGLTREQVMAGDAIRAGERWSGFMSHQIARARELYRQAIPGIGLLVADARQCAYACAAGYARILDAIETAGYDTWSRRVSASRMTLIGVAWQSWRGRLSGVGSGMEAASGAPAPAPTR